MSRSILLAAIADLSSAVPLTDANGGVIPAGTIAVEVQAVTQNIRYRNDGEDPTASVGLLLVAANPPTLLQGGLSNYKFIEVTSSASLVVNFIGHKILVVDPSSLANGTEDTAYSDTVDVSENVGSCTFTVTDGTLPTGLTLDSSTGVISGTPTVAGNSTFTVTATDVAGNTGSANYTLTIDLIIVIDVDSLEDGTNGVPYSDTVTTTGHVGARTFEVVAGALPTGLSLDGDTGVLSGTPSSADTFVFSIKVTDSVANTTTAEFSVVIS